MRGCRQMVQITMWYLAATFLVSALLWQVGAPIVVVIGAAALITVAFFYNVINWFTGAWRAIFAPTPAGLQPGPRPVDFLMQPFVVFGGGVLFFLVGAFFLLLNPEEQRAILNFLGNGAVFVLRTLGEIGQVVWNNFRGAVR